MFAFRPYLRKIAAKKRINIARLKQQVKMSTAEKAEHVSKEKVICSCEEDDVKIIGHFLENSKEKILFTCKCKMGEYQMEAYKTFKTKWPVLLTLYYESVYTHECKSKFCRGFKEKSSTPLTPKSNKEEEACRKHEKAEESEA